MGLLTSNDGGAELVVEGSEFAHNGAEGRHNHNLYAGSIRKLTVSGSYFHHARIGHLLKTRAAESRVLYNRLSDETGGTASYELEFPDGGVAIVIGNVIQQGAGTDNPAIVSFGAEGVKWPVNELLLVGNTLVDDSTAGGNFVVVKGPASRVVVANNLLLGRGSFVQVAGGEYRNNLRVQAHAFVDASRFDYRLPAYSPLLGRAEVLTPQRSLDVPPIREYLHPRRIRTLDLGAPQSPGAMQIPGLRIDRDPLFTRVAGAGQTVMLTRLLSALIALVCIALLVLAQVRHPFSPWWPFPLMLFFAALTLFAHGWWISVLLGILPILDLGQYSGSFFFEEFDYAVVSVAAAGYLRMFAFDRTPLRDRERGSWLRAGTLLVAAYLATLAVSMLIALVPLPPFDANAFAHYFSRYNALRVGKSGFAAMLLLPLVLHEFHRDAARARGAVLAGLALAFGSAGLSVVWERMAFANLTDFSSDFRVTGMFAATNTGGAALDAILAMTLPLCIAALLQENSRWRFLLWVMALGLGGYAMFVTFSRSLYASIAVVLVFQLFFASRSGAPDRQGTRGRDPSQC